MEMGAPRRTTLSTSSAANIQKRSIKITLANPQNMWRVICTFYHHVQSQPKTGDTWKLLVLQVSNLLVSQAWKIYRKTNNRIKKIDLSEIFEDIGLRIVLPSYDLTYLFPCNPLNNTSASSFPALSDLENDKIYSRM